MSTKSYRIYDPLGGSTVCLGVRSMTYRLGTLLLFNIYYPFMCFLITHVKRYLIMSTNKTESGVMVEQEVLDGFKKDGAFTSVFKIGPLYRWTYHNDKGDQGCEYYFCKDTAMSLHEGYVSAMKIVKQS